MADRRQELGLRQVGLLGLALGFTQAQLHAAALVDFAQQLFVEGGQFSRALLDPLFQVLIGLVQSLGGTSPFGDVADQHENPHHFAVGQAIRHVGAQHVALLVVDVGFGEFERHALPGQGPGHIGLQALIVLLAVGFAQALAEHHATGPAIPLFVDLVGELIDQVGIEVGDQCRHMVGDQPDPALAFTQRLSVLIALGNIGEGIDVATGGQRMGADFQDPAIGEALLAFMNQSTIAVAAGRGQ